MLIATRSLAVSGRSVLDGANAASVLSIASVLGVQLTVMETAVKGEV
jgi:hypothetical protein